MINQKIKKAYSLLELSIVIIIISVLVAGALTSSVGGINNAKTKATNDRIKEIYKAMGNFLIANRRLPCPASVALVKTVDATYGNEVGVGTDCSGSGVYQSLSSTNLVYGMVPARSLGLSIDMAEDAFGSKITYIVDKRFTNASLISVMPDFTTESFSTSGFTGTITVNEKPAGVASAATNDAIVVLISHGSNKTGAFNINYSTQNTRSTDADEMNNDATSFSGTDAVFDNVIVASSGNSDVFDDIVLFKRRNDFIEDFNAMFLIPCADAGVNFGVDINAYYGQVVYAAASCPNPDEDKRLTRKCEAYGAWVDIVAACP